MQNDTTSHTPESIHIKPRTLEHSFKQDIPRFWANNNPVITAFYNALSTIIPEGERFFIRSVAAVADHIENKTLKEEIVGFIAQEGSHRTGHSAMNDWIRDQGYPLAKNEHCIKRLLDLAQKHFSLKHKLAGTVALEHFSSLLADQFLRQSALQKNMHPAMRDFLVWHCIEECEHKAVAFDVYQTFFGNYYTRVIQQLLITLLFVPNVFLIQFSYLWHDGQLFNIKAWLGAIWYFWFKPGWFNRVTPGYFAFYNPRFHPWEHDNSALIDQYINEFKAKNAVIAEDINPP